MKQEEIFIKKIKTLFAYVLTKKTNVLVDEEFKEKWWFFLLDFFYSCKFYVVNNYVFVRCELSDNPELRFLQLLLLKEAERILNG